MEIKREGDEVSIPYRLAKNLLYPFLYVGQVFGFQSLIG